MIPILGHPRSGLLLVLLSFVSAPLACRTHSPVDYDVVTPFVGALTLSDSELYTSCLDTRAFSYEGKLFSSDSYAQRFDYATYADSIRRAFKDGRIVDITVSAVHKAGTSATLTARLLYRRYYSSGDVGFGYDFAVHSRFKIVSGDDKAGHIRIQRIIEEPLPEGGEVAPSFALIAYLHSDLVDVVATKKDTPAVSYLEERFSDKGTHVGRFSVKSRQESANYGITSTAIVFDSAGHRVRGVDWFFP